MVSTLDLKMAISKRVMARPQSGASRWLRRIGVRTDAWWPWNSPVRLTGAAVSGAGVALARGRLLGDRFEVEVGESIPGTNFLLGVYDTERWAGREVCVGLPRSRTLLRYYPVPAESESEIATMLPHLLANDLPTALEHYSWVWSPVQDAGDGRRLVAVYVARNDTLMDFIQPLEEAGLRVAGLVPEGWAWAHAARERDRLRESDAAGAPASVLVRGDTEHHLIVHRDGVVLHDGMIEAPSRSFVAGALDLDIEIPLPAWDGPELSEAREEFAARHGFAMPRFVAWPDELEAEALERDGPEDEDGEETDVAERTGVCFAASVAACALEQPLSMLPQQLRRRNRGRTMSRTLGVLARLAVIAALAWLALMMIEDRRLGHYLAGLETRIVAQEAEVGELETQLGAVREHSREQTHQAAIQRALASLRQRLDKPIYLESVTYSRGRGITLRGAAPTSEQVFAMTDQLAQDPLWQSLRVTQLRSEQSAGGERVHFVVEGQLQ